MNGNWQWIGFNLFHLSAASSMVVPKVGSIEMINVVRLRQRKVGDSKQTFFREDSDLIHKFFFLNVAQFHLETDVVQLDIERSSLNWITVKVIARSLIEMNEPDPWELQILFDLRSIKKHESCNLSHLLYDSDGTHLAGLLSQSAREKCIKVQHLPPHFLSQCTIFSHCWIEIERMDSHCVR